jgi:adenylate kinase family enzyme
MASRTIPLSNIFNPISPRLSLMSFTSPPRRPIRRIHIFGASGTGTTTLGRSLAARLGSAHFDTDDFFWLPTDPPYERARRPEERLRLMRAVLEPRDAWVLSGALCGWGDPLIPHFDLAVFLGLPSKIRMERLRARERGRFGDALLPGGSMHRQHLEFLEWASSYDDGDLTVRSRRLHEAWITSLPCPLLGIEGDRTNDERIAIVMEALAPRP